MDEIDQIKVKLRDKHVELRTPVDISDIRSFEKAHHVLLPQELVDFYTLISNGCEMIDGFDLYPFEKWKFDPERIHIPFGFKNYWIWEGESELAHDLKEIENGIIELIDIGDAQNWNIVVAGEKYGEMWFYTDVGIQPACPAMSFLKWFEYWLDGGTDYFYEFQYN